jgi:hypothetical protein
MLDLPMTREHSWLFYADMQQLCLDDGGVERWRAFERELGRNDLFYLMVRLLRRPDVNRDWLFDRCREVQANSDGYLDLWAREHYKSTLITFGLTMMEILINPESTIGIFSHTRPIAKGFLSLIKREIEDNQYLVELFPEIFWSNPSKQSPKWSEDGGLILKRKSNPKEPTLSAYGLVDGMPTGAHFSLRVYDDVVASQLSPEMIEKTTAAWDLSQNLGTVGGKVRYIGTRYSLHDTYAAMIDRGAAKARIYPATSNGRLDGSPVFFSQSEWDKRLKSSARSIIASQMLQNPMADEDATFRAEWLKTYEIRPRTLNVYIMADPSRGRHAHSDATAIAVVGISSTGAKYLLDGYCNRMKLSQRWIALRTLYHRWSDAKGVQHIAVGYERFGAQSDDEYFQEQMELDARRKIPNAHFPIDELNWPREGGNSKRERVERLEPDFRNGRFFLPSPILHNSLPSTWRPIIDPDDKAYGTIAYNEAAGLSKVQMEAIHGGSTDLVARAIIVRDKSLAGPKGGRYDLTAAFLEQFLNFPYGGHDDLIDATSRIYDMDPMPPYSPTARQDRPTVYTDGI